MFEFYIKLLVIFVGTAFTAAVWLMVIGISYEIWKEMKKND